MNYFKHLIYSIVLIFILSGCATNNQKNINKTNTVQISKLLNELHKKDLEIIKLKKALEKYEKDLSK